jgi:hypothetical protein
MEQTLHQNIAKSIAIVVITFLLFSFSPALKLQKINAADIAENHKTAAYNFAERQLKCCKTGEYTPLNISIAIPRFVNILTVEEMKEACVGINTDYGEFDKMTLMEILPQESTYYLIVAENNNTNAAQRAALVFMM